MASEGSGESAHYTDKQQKLGLAGFYMQFVRTSLFSHFKVWSKTKSYSCICTFEEKVYETHLISRHCQVMNVKQSYVSLQVPLYVSYVYYSPSLGWKHFDLDTSLHLKFVYDTSILWQEGISSSKDEDGLYGRYNSLQLFKK